MTPAELHRGAIALCAVCVVLVLGRLLSLLRGSVREAREEERARLLEGHAVIRAMRGGPHV